MRSAILIVMASLTLTGCGWFERKVVANFTGHSKMCVEGVTYLQFASGSSPQYTIDGKLVACQ